MVPVPSGLYPMEDGSGMSSDGVGYEMALKCGSGLKTIWGGNPPWVAREAGVEELGKGTNV